MMTSRYLPIADLLGDVAPAAAPEDDTQRTDRTASRGRPVLVPGRSAGGPDQLAGPVVEALIDCECSGSPTVLLAAAMDDLTAPVAAVCRYVVADQLDVIEAATGLFGADQVISVEAASVDTAGDWIGDLPAAPGRRSPLRERFVAVAQRVANPKDVYGKIRGR